MKVIHVDSLDMFQELYNKYNRKDDSPESINLVLLFIASNDPATKESWCSDCRKSKPVIDKVIQDFKYNDQLVLGVIQVGDSQTWVDDQNPYRTHELKITAVPTLLSVKTNERIVEEECLDKGKVSHIFSNSF